MVKISNNFFSISLAHIASSHLENEMKNGRESYDAWNDCSVALVMAAKAYGHYVVVDTFNKKLQTLASNQVNNFFFLTISIKRMINMQYNSFYLFKQCSASVLSVLTLLGKLYALNGIIENAGDFISVSNNYYQFFTSELC